MSSKTGVPILAVDVIIEKNDKLLLVTRKNTPFEGKLALPGGRVEPGETVEEAAIREIKEETGVKVELKDLLGVYSDPERDPRGRFITVVFIAKSYNVTTWPGEEVAAAQWFDTDSIKKEYMAFDHFKILQDYIKWKDERGTFWSNK